MNTLEQYLESLSIAEKKYGKESINTTHLYNNTGTVYTNLGDNAKAAEYYKKATHDL
jgi:tetratricopeptide (TPR) repeat protein